MKPIHSFLFFLYTSIVLFFIATLFPPNGIAIFSNFIIEFPTISEFLNVDDSSQNDFTENESLSELKRLESEMALKRADSLKLAKQIDSLKTVWKNLQYPENNKKILHDVFKEMESASANNKVYRIMHYGDSQVEGDRITSYLRNKLQVKFGGGGTGLFNIIEIAPRVAVKPEYSENWKRFPGFGKLDSTIKHKDYGVLMAFTRFKPPYSEADSTSVKAFFSLNKAKAAYATARKYNKLVLFYGFNKRAVSLEVVADGVVLQSQILPPYEGIAHITIQIPSEPEKLTLHFSGKDSPNIYGISLESSKGIVMDNIGMRGASGTDFSKQSVRTMKEMYAKLNPGLLILQFGGNVMPYIKDDKGAENYAKWFQSQIYFLKKNIPSVQIIVIGPSDMSVKEKDKYVTYPYLEKVRDDLKGATLSAGCVYWDMYEAMGGKNSMPKWVEADPPLAAPDYTHFSPSGTTKISELFYEAFMKDYNEFKNAKAGQN